MKTYSHPPSREISLDRVMHSLSDPCRVAIVRALLQSHGQELACSDIVLTISKATRSHHFDVLRDAGLIRTRVESTKCMTSLRTAELEKRFPGLLNLVLKRGGAAE
jgi:DNA-binding transcriptional ArsR family regulator